MGQVTSRIIASPFESSPSLRAASPPGPQAAVDGSMFRGGMMGELMRANNRIATLEADFAAIQNTKSKADEMRATIADSFTFERAAQGPGNPGTHSFIIQAPQFAAMCGASSSVASIFSVDFFPRMSPRNATILHPIANEVPASRFLLAGCPSAEGQPLSFSVPAPLGTRGEICVGLELFNVDLEDVGRSYMAYNWSTGGQPVETYLQRTRGCTRFSVHVNRNLGCLAVLPSKKTAIRQRNCTFTGESRGKWKNANAIIHKGEPSVFVAPCKLRARVPSERHGHALDGTTWVHVLGDSVTSMLHQHYVRAVTGLKAYLKYHSVNGSKLDKHQFGFICMPQVACYSSASWMDKGASFPTVISNRIAKGLPEMVRANGVNRTVPNIIMFSHGSHHKDTWGYDEQARNRFKHTTTSQVTTAVKMGTLKLVMLLETARDVAVTPDRFAHPSNLCTISNWRIQQRNLVMAEMFMQSCRTLSHTGLQCRVLDLFSPTITLTGYTPGLFFKERDPIHVLRPREAKLSFAAEMLHDLLESFDWSTRGLR